MDKKKMYHEKLVDNHIPHEMTSAKLVDFHIPQHEMAPKEGYFTHEMAKKHKL